MDKRVVAAIRACSTKSELNDVFSRFDIKSLPDKYSTLVEAMYNPQMFFSCSAPDDELRYELALELFLTMSWKTSELLQNVRGVQNA